MAHSPNALVLDSWSVLAYLKGEPRGKLVAALMAEAHKTRIPLHMCVVNIGEVWYILARETSPAEADKVIEQLQQEVIKGVDADWNLTRVAAAYKSTYKIAYADCFAAALAKINDAELITGDPEFKQLEGEIRIQWL
ncbi:MAG: type II toxin-antitoxin system VapC family toxin [Candidatus Brocadiales bacterium]|nr:type II toxin-antitoxin system VapC family toxin [Candidatus Bathyanammoxibius sp.]